MKAVALVTALALSAVTLVAQPGRVQFTDVTAAAGLISPVNSQAISWADFDNDGHLDLFIGNETGRNYLYKNLGDGSF